MIYEIINKGVGIIDSLLPENLLLIDSDPVSQPTSTSQLTNQGADGTSPYVEFQNLSPVATSGSYLDLIDTPEEIANTLDEVLAQGNTTESQIEIGIQGAELTTLLNGSIVLENATESANYFGKGISVVADKITSALYNIYYPNTEGSGIADYILPLSVNGLVADADGNIELPTTAPSLQEVIDVNKVADRVEFSKNVINVGQVRGAYVYLVSSLRMPGKPDPEKTYIYGDFDSIDNIPSSRIARINADGSIDQSFVVGTGFNLQPYAGSDLEFTETNGIFVSGSFTEYNGVPANRIIALSEDGSIDTSFVYGTGFDGHTGGLALNGNGKLYVGGLYSSYNGTPANRIIKLNSDGSVDPTFIYGTGFDNTTVDIFVDSDESIFVTGGFSNYNGTYSRSIAKIGPDGTIDPTFNSNGGFTGLAADYFTNFIFRDLNGVLISYGYFTTYQGIEKNRIVALNNDGSISTAYDFGSGFDGDIYSLQPTFDGKYIIEGGFSMYNGIESNGIILLNADFTVYKTFVDSYYNVITGSTNTYLMTTIGDYDQIFNLLDGIPVTKKSLTFSEVTGKAEYNIGGLSTVGSEELMPRRLIEELVFNTPAVLQDLQSVLDIGNSSSGKDIILNYANFLSISEQEVGSFSSTGISLIDNENNSYLTIIKNSIQAGFYNPNISNKLIIGDRVALGEAAYGFNKNKVAGTYTIATLDDITESPFELIDEGTGLGIIVKGRIAANYGSVGQGAVDLSFSSEISTVYGATGLFSFAEGFNNISSGFTSRVSGAYSQATNDYANAEGSYTVASGYASHAEGEDSIASGNLSHAQGDSVASGSHAHSEGLATIASGNYSHAQGRNNYARSAGEHAGGLFGTDYAPTGTDTDRLVNYGNGTSEAALSDAFTLFKNGLLTLPSINNSLIDAETTGKALVTREWADSKMQPKETHKEYKAIVTYSGGDAGTFTVVTLKNTLSDDVVWTRTNVGFFQGVLAGAFPKISTLFIGSGKSTASNAQKFDTFVSGGGDRVTIAGFDTLSGAASDASFTFHVSVEVYS